MAGIDQYGVEVDFGADGTGGKFLVRVAVVVMRGGVARGFSFVDENVHIWV